MRPTTCDGDRSHNVADRGVPVPDPRSTHEDQAAVVYEAGKRIEIEELTLDKPQAGEVLIRYTHAGLCHSDVHIAHGDLEARLPMVLGHEGAGIIEEVGRA